MSLSARLSIGKEYSNSEICDIFKCSAQGGMRRSRKTGTLVLISDHTKNLYHDRWIGNTFHYTGMGQEGDQRLEFHQNKTLNESRVNGVIVHLFEGFSPKSYMYMGIVCLANDPYEESQPDANGFNRRVWVFPLRRADGLPPCPVPLEALKAAERKRERRTRALSDESLEASVSALASHGQPSKRSVTENVFERNPYVVELARRRAKGVCQLCGQEAPFRDKDGTPFLEVHHINWLSRGGQDTIENTVALCPNCHRRVHVLDREEDRKALISSNNESMRA